MSLPLNSNRHNISRYLNVEQKYVFFYLYQSLESAIHANFYIMSTGNILGHQWPDNKGESFHLLSITGLVRPLAQGLGKGQNLTGSSVG